MKKTSRFVALSIGLAICCGIALPAINYAVNIDTSTPATHGTRFHSLYLGNQETDPNATLMQANNNLLYISNGIIAGKGNNGAGELSSIGGGSNNTVNADNAGIAGGQENTVNGNNGIIGGGQYNTAGTNATVIGGNWNTATENGNILGGAKGNAEGNGTVLGGSGNSAGENGLALGQNSNGGQGSFTWNATEENDNSARVDTDNGVLIGTNTPISGVDLVVSGSIKLNEGQKIGTGLQGEVRVVDGCFYLYDGMTWNLISQADTGNCKGWSDTAGTDISPAKTCEFGKIELKEGDKVWAYSATMNPNCESIKAEVTCKDGSLKTALLDTKYIYSYCHDGSGEVTEIICEPQPACGGNKCAQGKASAKLGDDSFTCASECGTKNCTCSGTTKWNTSTNTCTDPLCLGKLPIFSTGSNITPTKFEYWNYDPNLSSACTYKCNQSTCTSDYTLTGQNITGASTYARCFNYTHSEGNCIQTQKYKVTSCQTGYKLKNGKCELVVCPANTCTSDYTLSSPEAPNARTYTPCSNFSTDGLCTETKKWKIESCNLGNCDSSYALTGENDPHATSYAECTSYKLENDCSPQHKYKVKTCEEGYSLGKDGLCHKDCYLEGDGTHVKYNEGINAYTAQNPECPTNCGATQERKCVGTDPENSYLNGNNQYKYSSCTPQPITCDSDYKYYSPIVSNAKEYATCTEYTVSNKTCNSTPKYKVTKCNDGYYLTNGECKPTSCNGQLPPNAIGSTKTPSTNTLYWTYNTNNTEACTYKCEPNECTSEYTLTSQNVSNATAYASCTNYVGSNCTPTTKHKVTACESNDCSGYPLTGQTSTAFYTSGYKTCTTYTPTNSSCTPQIHYKPICKSGKTCDISFNLTERKSITGLSGYEECYDIGLIGGSCNKINTKYKLICKDGYNLSADGKYCDPITPVCIPETCSGYNLTTYSEPVGTKYSSCTKRDASCQETLVHQVVSCPVGNCTDDYTLTEQNVANAASFHECTSYDLKEDGHCYPKYQYKVTCQPGYELYNGSCVKICTPDTTPGCGNGKTGSAEKGSSTYKCGSTTCSCADLGDNFYWDNDQKICVFVEHDACGNKYEDCNSINGRELKPGSTGATSTEYYWTCTWGVREELCTEEKTYIVNIDVCPKRSELSNGSYYNFYLTFNNGEFEMPEALQNSIAFAVKKQNGGYMSGFEVYSGSNTTTSHIINPYSGGEDTRLSTPYDIKFDFPAGGISGDAIVFNGSDVIVFDRDDDFSNYANYRVPSLNTEYYFTLGGDSCPSIYNTLTYNANGGSGAPSSQTFTQGNSVTLRSGEPTRTNYKFLGWSTSPTATVASYQPGHTYTFSWGDTTLYAVWEGVCNLVAQPGGTNGTIHTSDLSSISIDSSFGGTKSQPTITCGGNSGPIACTSTASYQNGTIYKYSTTENNNITRISISNNCTQIILTVEPDEPEPEEICINGYIENDYSHGAYHLRKNVYFTTEDNTSTYPFDIDIEVNYTYREEGMNPLVYGNAEATTISANSTKSPKLVFEEQGIGIIKTYDINDVTIPNQDIYYNGTNYHISLCDDSFIETSSCTPTSCNSYNITSRPLSTSSTYDYCTKTNSDCSTTTVYRCKSGYTWDPSSKTCTNKSCYGKVQVEIYNKDLCVDSNVSLDVQGGELGELTSSEETMYYNGKTCYQDDVYREVQNIPCGTYSQPKLAFGIDGISSRIDAREKSFTVSEDINQTLHFYNNY